MKGKVTDVITALQALPPTSIIFWRVTRAKQPVIHLYMQESRSRCGCNINPKHLTSDLREVICTKCRSLADRQPSVRSILNQKYKKVLT